MELNKALIKKNQTYEVKETIDLSSYLKKDDNVIKSISPFDVTIKATNFGEMLHIDFYIKGKAILICSRSLEDMDYSINIKDEIDFTSEEDFASEDVIYEPKMKIDLDPYLFGSVIAEIPNNPIKKGAKMPKSGSNYEFLTEDEYNKRKEEEKTSPFDCLKDLDLD